MTANEINWKNEQTKDAFEYATDQIRTAGGKCRDIDMGEKVKEWAANPVHGLDTEGLSKIQTDVAGRKDPIADLSKDMLATTALYLRNSFGDGAPYPPRDTGDNGWLTHMARAATARVNWPQLADQLLRRHVPEYKPTEVD